MTQVIRMKTQDLNNWFQTMSIDTNDITKLKVSQNIKNAILTLIAPYAQGIQATFEFPDIDTNKADILHEKLIGLCDIIRHADDDKFTHVSKGMIQNVALTTIKHIYRVATNNNNENDRPYVVTNDPDVSNILSKVFILLYASNQENENRQHLYDEMTRFAVICLLLANRTPSYTFNKPYPLDNMTQDAIYTATAQYAKSLGM